jgi:acyl carrier protein
MAFEEEFNTEIPDEEAEKLTTVGAALEYLKQKLG